MSAQLGSVPTAKRTQAGLNLQFPWTRGRIILAVVTAIGFITGVIRFAIGLGPTTNLSDAWPWGLWIGFNVLSAVALSGGAFTLAGLVYIFNVKRFKPLTRAAVLAGFLGYITVVLGLLVELGQPHRVWYPWIMWQHHSVMFEVAWCVTLYLLVLALEFAPVVFERLNWDVWEKRIHRALIPLVIAGIVLSTLHQSSLGTMFLLMPHKINPLWYSSWLPVLFFITSIGAGLAAFSLIYMWAARSCRRRPDANALAAIAKIIPWVYVAYLAIRLIDLTVRGAWTEAAQVSLVSIVFWVELLAGMILPTILLFSPAVRRNLAQLQAVLLLIVGGVILNRVGVSLVGVAASVGAPYTPSLMEFLISAGITTGAALVYLFLAENARVLPEDEEVSAA